MWPPAVLHTKPSILVVDDFYANPYDVRSFALGQVFREHRAFYRGSRTKPFLFPYVKERFEALLGIKIHGWTDTEGSANGVFQICLKDEQNVFHSDLQGWAGAVYLTPDAPVRSGTVFYRSKETKLRRPATWLDTKAANDPELNKKLYQPSNLTDPAVWEEVDRVGNIFNRLVLWDGSMIHAAGDYFGEDRDNGRLFQLFFFDGE